MDIDATNHIAGRLASIAAKKALLGEEITIVHSEEAIITGTWENVLQEWKGSREKGSPRKGPFISRMPDRLLRRMIRGMLPFERARGREAFQRVKCYVGVPKELQGRKFEQIKEADASKLSTLRYVKLKDLSRQMGGKI
ncbi:50S ribosomal protein L13 [Candidatus Woesearchaeota archaeon]|nr:50S ribosomal protein L13 [Candidatus Woesearchaeota archaeon]